MNRPIFNWSQISAFRLTRHHLVDQNRADLATVCQHVCGVQAQVMGAAEVQFWATGLSSSRMDLARGLAQRTGRRCLVLHPSKGTVACGDRTV